MNHRQSEEIIITLPQLTLRGLRWGTSEQPLIIALHGWLDNAASFSMLAPLLTDYQVIALDFPGHGYTDDLAHTEDYSFINFITIITQAIEQLTSQPVILMGHSLGGAFLSFISVEFPHFVKRLILIDSLGLLSAECANGETRLAQWLRNFYRVEGKPLKVYNDYAMMINTRAEVTGINYDAILPLAKRGLLQMREGFRWRVDSRLSLKELTQFSEQQTITLLAAINIPTLEIEATQGVIHGNNLITTRINCIKPLTLDILDGPHHIHLAEPEKVATLINQFLQK